MSTEDPTEVNHVEGSSDGGGTEVVVSGNHCHNTADNGVDQPAGEEEETKEQQSVW